MMQSATRNLSTLATGLLLAFALASAGCTGGSSAPPAIPATPDGTVLAVCKGLGECKPEYLWAALPASYQKDVQDDIVRAFAAKMDPEMYGKGAAVLKKLAGVLGAKRDMLIAQIVAAPMFADAQIDRAGLERNWDAVVGLLHALLASELGDLGRLKTIDMGSFLATTGGAVMQKIAALSAVAKDDPFATEFKAKMLGAKAEVLKVEGDKATLKLTTAGEPEETVEFVRVEGKWLPAEMAADWRDRIGEAKAEIAALDAQRMAAAKPQVMGMLAAADAVLDQLAAAKTAEEFNQALAGVLQNLPIPMGF